MTDSGGGTKGRKLLFFDIDGTLIFHGSAPSPATVAAIRSARKRGHLAFLSTGRMEKNVPPPVAAIGFDGGIYSSGCRVVAEGQELLHRAMPRLIVERTLAVLQSERVWYVLDSARKGSQNGGTVPQQNRQCGTAWGSEWLCMAAQLRDRRRAAQQYAGEPVYKISFFALSSRKIRRIESQLDKTVQLVRFDNLSGDAPVISCDIASVAIDKGQAMAALCAYYRMDAGNCVAFGDSMNDAAILQAAGTGIAMGNADKALWPLADQICESCAADGVAKTLLRMGLA